MILTEQNIINTYDKRQQEQCRLCYKYNKLKQQNPEFEVLSKNREEFFSIIKDIIEKFGNIIKTYEQLVVYKELIIRSIPLG